jgi:hypothetical protein
VQEGEWPLIIVCGCGGGGRDNRVAMLKMVTKGEHQLIDLNTEPRLLTDREGEAGFSVLWSYVTGVANIALIYAMLN